MIKKLPLTLFFLVNSLYSQSVSYNGSLNFQALASSDTETPFWFYSNQRGRIDKTTVFSTWGNLAASFYFNPNSFLKIGVGALFQNGYSNEFQVDEFFLNFQNDWLSVIAGRKQKEELFQGLSAGNENILNTLNARPMTGLSLSTSRPVVFWKEAGLGFKASWEELLMDDDRYVQNTRLHHKSVHLVFSKIRNLEISAGLQHFAQWAGTSPRYGKLPGSLSDYVSVITGSGMTGKGREGIEDQETNALGNHLGSYEVNLKTFFRNYEVELLYNHLFEDGSGIRYGNFPDGRYGIYVSDKKNLKFISAFMYEFYYTKNQSKNSSTTDGSDNYFNNNMYRSGWTYESRVIGAPFFILKENRHQIGINKFIVHHFGIKGLAFKTVPYKLLTSYRKNYGSKDSEFSRTRNVLSTYLDLLLFQAFIDLKIQIGGDLSSEASPVFGAGIQVSKTLF